MPSDYDRHLKAARKGARDLSHGVGMHNAHERYAMDVEPPIKGGQGRDDDETAMNADLAWAIWVIALVVAFGLGLYVALILWVGGPE